VRDAPGARHRSTSGRAGRSQSPERLRRLLEWPLAPPTAAPERKVWTMSDTTMEPLPDGDGKLGNAEGPADSGAGDPGTPGEHDGGADGGAGGGAGASTEGPADSGAGESGMPGEHDGGADGGADASR
jgi:hypothetical protein